MSKFPQGHPLHPDSPGSALLMGVVAQVEVHSQRCDLFREALEGIRDSSATYADELREMAFEALMESDVQDIAQADRATWRDAT